MVAQDRCFEPRISGMISVLLLLGWIALIVGGALLIAGYAVNVRLVRPGWGLLIAGVVLLLLGYLLVPALVTGDADVDVDGMRLLVGL